MAWLAPEATWTRTRTGVIRHPKRNALLLAGLFVVLLIALRDAVRARAIGGAILHLFNAAIVAGIAWYF